MSINNLSTLEIIANELAEVKARQQAINEVLLIVFEGMSEWAANANNSEYSKGLYPRKYLEFYEHYIEKYRQENMDNLRFAAEDSANENF